MAKMSSIVLTIFFFIAAVSQEGHAAYSETAFVALKAQAAGNRANKFIFCLQNFYVILNYFNF